jgi:hypothetical protein
VTAHMLAIGYATRDGVFVRTGDGYQAQAQELTPLGRDVEPCPCGRPDCDCDEWHEIMNADPHGDVSWRESVEVSY